MLHQMNDQCPIKKYDDKCLVKKYDECLAKQYLNELGRDPVVFEPDGKIPPDFTLAGCIGVEVRRLNLNYEHPDGSSEGVEEWAIRRRCALKNLFGEIGPSVNGESWFVNIDFRRPVEFDKPFKEEIGEKLKKFMDSPNREPKIISVGANFELHLSRANIDKGYFFMLGGCEDDDLGWYWSMTELEKNLRFCIEKKERKIAPHRKKYTKWWLILVDYICYVMGQDDQEVFRANHMPNIRHSFDKIILLDPRDHHRAFEITSPSS